MNKMYFVFSCLGFIGGLLCCTGDIFFDLKGREDGVKNKAWWNEFQMRF